LKILIDTNVFIPLEPSSIEDVERLSPEATRLFQVIQEERHEIFLHPKSRIDIDRDRNADRKTLRLLAFDKYPQLLCAEPFTDFWNCIERACPESHDYVDNYLLFSVVNNAVDLLVTEDRGIHRKARRLGVESRVCRIFEATRMVERLVAPELPYPSVEKKKAYELNLADPFFDSLRQDYDGFGDWFEEKCQRGHRDCFVIDHEDRLSGICVFKAEDSGEYGLLGHVLKACTLKVADHAKGLRFGELLLKALMFHAYAEGYDYIYVTAFRDNEPICVFLDSNGFTELADQVTPLGEAIFVKKVNPSDDDLCLLPHEYHLQFGPKYLHPASKSFVVPIQPKYHDMLFPELTRQLGLFETPQPFGNGISKAYLCHASTNHLNPGDVLFFYRSQQSQSIQALGVVDGWIRSNNPETIGAFVGKRTVYSQQEIDEMCDRPVLAILFRQANGFSEPNTKSSMENNGVFGHAPQTICSLSTESSAWLLSHSRT
jgi:GNAT superfamily N-acetyltransferase